MRIGGLGIYIGRRRGGWSLSGDSVLLDKILFWGKVSEISGGQMPNKIDGATDYITVTGSPATYQVPNTAPYIAADTDLIWFYADSSLRTATTDDLVSYDFPRTLIKYDNSSPYTLREIIILKTGEVLTATEENNLRDYMQLSVWWDNTLSAHGNVKGNRASGKNTWTVYEPETDALITRMATLSEEPLTARKVIINTAISGLKTNSLWAKLDALWTTASHGTLTYRLNWIEDAYNLTDGVAPTFTIDRGVTGNGSSMYLKTGIAPNAGGFHYTQNAASFGLYSRTTGTGDSTDMGAFVTRASLKTRNTADKTDCYINVNSIQQIANTDGSGFYAVVRDAATTQQAYKNKVRTNASKTATGLPEEFYLLALSASGAASGFSSREISFAFIGGSLSETDIGHLYDIMIDGYLNSIGAKL